jgi:hypothetical protein
MTVTTLAPRPETAAGGDGTGAPPDALPVFMPGDIILFAGRGDLYSRVSRWIMRTAGEGPTYAVHTAQFIDAGRYIEIDMVGKIRATPDILKKRLARDLWTRRGFEVWRLESLTAGERDAVTRQALSYVGARFGFGKMFTHLLDGLISRAAGRDVFAFRRLNHDTRYPTCSWITAFSYDRALHYRFGVPPEWADPDQIADWVSAPAHQWARVYRLATYT